MNKTNLIIRALFLALLAATAAQEVPAQMTGQKVVKIAVKAPSSKLINAEQMLRDLETLAADDMQGRWVGTEGGVKARRYVLEKFEQAGLKPFGESFVQPFEFANRKGERFQGANIVGFVKGKRNADRYIVLTAHYDHVGVRDGQIYNGADDNASGTAALLALAAYFHKNRPDNSLIFAAVDAEEAGLQGSKKFVAAPPVEKERIVMNINLDMLGQNGKNELYAVGTYHYPFLKPYLETVVKTAPVKLSFGYEGPNVPRSSDWTFQSDHFSFHQAKIPFVYFGVEDHKDYHKPSDDFVNITPEFFVHAVETVLAAVKTFDRNLAHIEKQKAELK